MADQWKSMFVLFTKEDQVWLDSRNLKTIYHKKMKPKREGPFFITKVLGPVTYRLHLPATWRIHDIFHAVLLQPYKENEIYGENFVKPPPELEEGKEVYDVETILMLRLQTIKTIVTSRRFKGSSYDEPRRVQVLDLYCLTRFESENSRRGDVY